MGDVENGKKVFMRSCAACHTLDNTGKHKAGPNLFGIFGKKAGTTPGYKFSDANANYGTWSDDSFDRFIDSPAKAMPGNRMVFPGMKKAKDRQDLAAYMKSQK